MVFRKRLQAVERVKRKRRRYVESKKDRWQTPPEEYNPLNAEFKFDLDPCADRINAKCPRYFTRENNGLLQRWKAHAVFVNPPYSNIHPWIMKALTEISIGNTSTIVMLLPANRSDQEWWKDLWGARLSRDFSIDFRWYDHRIQFIEPDDFKGDVTSPRFPSLVAVIRRNVT